MDQEKHKRRKCGPRVKTGCITCRIRRVKCDEGKPDCNRCVSTGRKCDGYVSQQKPNNSRSQLRPKEGAMEVVRRPEMMITAPWDSTETQDINDIQRRRQLFHFYCIQSAFDLSVYHNTGFWHDMILQYSQYHPVVRQAVVAFGSSHMYALSMNQSRDVAEASRNALDQVRQYDRAIRSLRSYMEKDSRPDPHVVLICCALFFSCENARGNREAAWQHLENGLHILNSVQVHKAKKLLKPGNEVSDELELVASKNGSVLKAKTDKVDVDEELVYVFSRLDVQATLCKETRKPVLNLAEISSPTISDPLTHATTFATITEAQRSLDFIHNRLARFLSSAAASESGDRASPTPEPDWVDNERTALNQLCANWETCMYSFVSDQQPGVKQHLQTKYAPNMSSNPEWQLALQIQLLNLHHRCWWMLFRSYNNPSVWTIVPNHRAAEILDVCEFLGFALPLRPSAVYNLTKMDIAWKMISEIGVTAPLFVIATKCTDISVRNRALSQLIELRKHGNGMYHETFLDQVIKVVMQPPEQVQSSSSAVAISNSSPESAQHRLQQLTHPTNDHDYGLASSSPSTEANRSFDETQTPEQDQDGLLGWSKH